MIVSLSKKGRLSSCHREEANHSATTGVVATKVAETISKTNVTRSLIISLTDRHTEETSTTDSKTNVAVLKEVGEMVVEEAIEITGMSTALAKNLRLKSNCKVKCLLTLRFYGLMVLVTLQLCTTLNGRTCSSTNL